MTDNDPEFYVPLQSGDQSRICFLAKKTENHLEIRESSLTQEFHNWEKSSLNGLKFAGSFTCGEIIGKGSFGTIRIGRNDSRNDMESDRVAIKLEKRRHSGSPCLDKEFSFLKRLQKASIGFPSILALVNLGPYRALVMQLLGPNLQCLFERCGKLFSTHCVALIAIQLLDRFEFLHSEKILYRDVKGENFLIGFPGSHSQNTIHIVDFGLAQNWKNDQYARRSPAGTPRYMSLRTHMGKQPSYRDDLESLSFLLIYFAKGKLPWQGLHDGTTIGRIKRIGIKKGCISPEELCQLLPISFSKMLRASRSLPFDRQADFNELRTLFYQVLSCEKGDCSTEQLSRPTFDWIEKKISLDLMYEKSGSKHNWSIPKKESPLIITHTGKTNLSDLETPELLRRLTDHPPEASLPNNQVTNSDKPKLETESKMSTVQPQSTKNEKSKTI